MASAVLRQGRHSAPVEPPAESRASRGLPLLAAGDLRATVDARAGGRIAAFWREDREGGRFDIIAPLPSQPFDPLVWPKAGIYPLVPWSNRIRDARFVFDGRTIAIPCHPACPPHALHGFAQANPWSLLDHGDRGASMRFAHDPAAQGGHPWPWAFEARQDVRLDSFGLTIEIDVRNCDSRTMPGGFGIHPFFARGAGDAIDLAVGGIWETDDAGCAVGRRAASRPAVWLPLDGERDIIGHYSDWRGVATLRRASGERIIMLASGELDHLVVYAPAGAPFACIEPVSHVVDAFNLTSRGVAGAGTMALEPGETRSATVRICLA